MSQHILIAPMGACRSGRPGAAMRRPIRTLAGAAALAAALSACSVNDALRVQDPDVARPQGLEGKEFLPTQLAAAIGDFQVAFSGSAGSEGLVNMTGLFTDEFSFTETFPTRIVVDQRNIETVNTTMLGIYFNVQKARASADRAAGEFAEFDPAASGAAEALSLGGFSDVLIADAYCSGVPDSKLESDGSITYGQPLTTEQRLNQGIGKFDAASSIAQAAGDVPLSDLARVGKAHALMDLGSSQFAAADVVADSVSSDFEYVIFHSANSPRQYNGIWEFMWNEGRWSQADSEGTNGLAYRSAGDPRTPFEFLGRGFASGTKLYGTLKYNDRSSPVVLASYVEARLIHAEAELAAGNVAEWLSTLNALRSTVAGLAPLTDPGVATDRVSLTFQERAFWLYATGHRMGDLRRLSRSTALGGYGRNPESVFPTGTYIYRGSPFGVYGTQTSFPIPIEEENNPNFQGCLSTEP